MTFNPAQPRDAEGQWTDAGGSGGAVAHPHSTSSAHNSQFSGVGRAFASGTLQSALLSGGIGAGIGLLTGGPVGAGLGAVGGVTSGLITGGLAAAVYKHDANVELARRSGAVPEGFWAGTGGTVVKRAALIGAFVGGAFAAGAASQAASGAFTRTFYGGARGGGFTEEELKRTFGSGPRGGFTKEEAYKAGHETGSKFRGGSSNYYARREAAREAGIAAEKAKVAARMAEKARSDPMARKAEALRAKAADRSVTDAERRAFQAKADEFLKRHRAGPPHGRHVSTKH